MRAGAPSCCAAHAELPMRLVPCLPTATYIHLPLLPTLPPREERGVRRWVEEKMKGAPPPGAALGLPNRFGDSVPVASEG